MAASTVVGAWPTSHFWGNALYMGGYAIVALLVLMALQTPADRFVGSAIAFAGFQACVLLLSRSSESGTGMAIGLLNVIILAPLTIGAIVASFYPSRRKPRPHVVTAALALFMTTAPLLVYVAWKYLIDPY